MTFGEAEQEDALVVGLVGSVDGEGEVVGLDLGHGGELDVKLGQVSSGDHLVEGLIDDSDRRLASAHQAGQTDTAHLGKDVDTKGVLLVLSPEGDLCERGQRRSREFLSYRSRTFIPEAGAPGQESGWRTSTT